MTLVDQVQLARAENQIKGEGGAGCESRACARCGADLPWPRPGKPGRPRRYCSPLCRARASEARGKRLQPPRRSQSSEPEHISAPLARVMNHLMKNQR